MTVAIQWFSPLPPAKTDIANYTARVLHHLQARTQIILIDPDTSGYSDDLVAPGNLSHSQRDFNRGGVPVYHLGNNVEFHLRILEIALTRPGIVVLHDRVVTELVLGALMRRDILSDGKAERAFMSLMAGWYGNPGLQAATEVLSGRCQPSTVGNAFPLYEHVIERALGVVCHNPAVAEEISRRFCKLPVLSLPLPYETPQIRRRPRLIGEGTVIRLVMFGFMGLNRRACEFLEVWSASPYRDRFYLDISGEMQERTHFDGCAARLGLSMQTTHHGYLSDAALDQVISQADMAINLRNPSMGEASGSQLRIWANGCPSVVSDTGWYATLPDSCVRKVGIDSESVDLGILLSELAEGRVDLEKLAAEGYAQLQLHAPDCYVSDLIDWIDQGCIVMGEKWAQARFIDAAARGYSESLPLRQVVNLPAGLRTVSTYG